MGYNSFEELEVWEKSRDLKNDIWELVKSFPPVEKYLLTDQLIRSSRGICNQIAEGHGRKTYPDRLRFTIMARGSVSETVGHLIDALDCTYITEELFSKYRKQIVVIEKLMNGYVTYLESKVPDNQRIYVVKH